MPPEGGTLADYAFAMLDLLTREASQSSFEDLVRQARRAGATAEELEQLARAKEHSLGIRQLFAHRRQREAGLSALVDTARDLTQPYTLDALLKVITRRARLLLGLDMSWVSFHDPDTGSSLVRAADGHASAITVGFRVPLGGGIGHLARSRSAPFWTPDYLADDGFPHSGKIDEVVRSEGLRAIMALPLQHEDDTFGVLYVADRNVRHFTPADLALMASLADLAAVAIERTHLLTQARAKAGETDLDGAWPADAPPALESSPGARRRRSSRRELIDMVLDGADLPALVEQGAASLGGALLVRDPPSAARSPPMTPPPWRRRPWTRTWPTGRCRHPTGCGCTRSRRGARTSPPWSCTSRTRCATRRTPFRWSPRPSACCC
jgi:GAF domain-containing protein